MRLLFHRHSTEEADNNVTAMKYQAENLVLWVLGVSLTALILTQPLFKRPSHDYNRTYSNDRQEIGKEVRFELSLFKCLSRRLLGNYWLLTLSSFIQGTRRNYRHLLDLVIYSSCCLRFCLCFFLNLLISNKLIPLSIFESTTQRFSKREFIW